MGAGMTIGRGDDTSARGVTYLPPSGRSTSQPLTRHKHPYSILNRSGNQRRLASGIPVYLDHDGGIGFDADLLRLEVDHSLITDVPLARHLPEYCSDIGKGARGED